MGLLSILYPSCMIAPALIRTVVIDPDAPTTPKL